MNRETKRRTSYIKAKLSTLVSSQIMALRIHTPEFKPRTTDKELSEALGIKKQIVSDMTMPGGVNFNIETLSRLAAVFKTGIVIKFVPIDEMLKWDNEYSQDDFYVAPARFPIEEAE